MSIGTPEVITCLIIALLVLGPDKLPGAARMLGRGYAEFKKITGDVQGQLKDFINEDPEEQATTETAKQARGEASTVGVPTEKPVSARPGDEPAVPPLADSQTPDRQRSQLGRDLSQMPKTPPVPGGQAGNAPPARHPGTDGFQMIDTNPPVLRSAAYDPDPDLPEATPATPDPDAVASFGEDEGLPESQPVTVDDYQPRRSRATGESDEDAPLEPWRTYGSTEDDKRD